MSWMKALGKQIILLAAALFLSVLVVELGVGKLVGFPPLGVSGIYHVYPGDRYLNGSSFENVYQPHCRYINVERGFKVYRYNNLGLPGSDVVMGPGCTSVVVLGNSYVESKAVPPEKISTSVCMEILRKSDPSVQVINLGKGGQIPDLGFHRLSFWAQRLQPDWIVLVLNDAMVSNAEKYGQEVDPEREMSYPPVTEKKIVWANRLLGVSAFANCLRTGIKYSAKDARRPDPEPAVSVADGSFAGYERGLAILASNIMSYKQQYGDQLLVYSMFSGEYAGFFKDFCRIHGIHHRQDSNLMSDPRCKIGEGHFNEFGNKLLGENLAQALGEEMEIQQRIGRGSKDGKGLQGI